ncbi:MAG: PPE domain-containing protein, partial [Sciscionella sp.]
MSAPRAPGEAGGSSGGQPRRRQLTDEPDTDYQGFDHDTLYSWLHEDFDPAGVHGTAQAWQRVRDVLATQASELHQAVLASRAEWTGAAASRAQHHLSELGGWAQRTAEAAGQAASALRDQAEAATLAQHTMPEPAGFTHSEGLAELRGETDPIAFTLRAGLLQQRAAHHQDVHQQAVDVMQGYHRNLSDAAAMPGFDAAPGQPTPPPGDTPAHRAGGRRARQRRQEPPDTPETQQGYLIEQDRDDPFG